MQNLIQLFLNEKIAISNAAQNTALAYGRDLLDFEQYLLDHDTTLINGRKNTIEDYLVALAKQGLAKSTRARRLSAIKQFYQFCFEEGQREDNPALQVAHPRLDQKLPGTLSIEQAERLLTCAQEFGKNAYERARNGAMMELLYASGMRVSELLSLPHESLRGDPNMIVVKGKGGKERIVPLSSSARLAVQDWLKLRDMQKKHEKSPFLFPSRSKQGHITRIWFYGQIKKIAMQAGLRAEQVSPHTLRHAFATHLLQGGADLRTIQKLLGHADIATTEIYTHIAVEQLEKLVHTQHPLATQPRRETS